MLARVALLVLASGLTFGLSVLLAARGLAPWLAVSAAASAVLVWAVAFSMAPPLRALPSGRRGRARRLPVAASRRLPAEGPAATPPGAGRPARARRRWSWKTPAVLWTASLVLGLLLPDRISEPLATSVHPAVTHTVAFAVLTGLWLRVFPHAPLRVAAYAAAFALATEMVQWLTPALGRGASTGDFAADGLGIGLGLVGGWMARPRRQAALHRRRTGPGAPARDGSQRRRRVVAPR